MDGIKQNMEHLSDQSAQGVELRAMSGMQTFIGITENGLTAIEQERDSLLEYILSPSKLNEAYKQVKNFNHFMSLNFHRRAMDFAHIAVHMMCC
jgi:hypothetical protein